MSDTARVGTTRAFESRGLLPSETQISTFSCDIAREYLAMAASVRVGQVLSDGTCLAELLNEPEEGELVDHRLELVGNVVGRNDESIGLCADRLPIRRSEGDASGQSRCQHSHRKPVVSSRSLTHSARRSFRLLDHASLCAMRSSREPNGSWNASATDLNLALLRQPGGFEGLLPLGEDFTTDELFITQRPQMGDPELELGIRALRTNPEPNESDDRLSGLDELLDLNRKIADRIFADLL